MTPDQLFSIANVSAMAGWTLLVLFPRTAWAQLIARLIPLALAVLYLLLLVAHWGEASGSFSTLTGVASLFSNRWVLLAGWVHYLAFDLFIGSWEVRDAIDRGLSHLLVVPCLVLTFLFGPVGFLAYTAISSARPGSRLHPVPDR